MTRAQVTALAGLAVRKEFNETRRLGLSMRASVQILKDAANGVFEGYDPVSHGRRMLDADAAIDALAAR